MTDTAGNDFSVWLTDCWTDTPVSAGDTVSVVAPWDAWGEAHVTLQSGFLVLHPEILVSATAVGSAFSCVRKAALAERFGSGGAGGAGGSPATFVGTLLHELFQVAMAEGPEMASHPQPQNTGTTAGRPQPQQPQQPTEQQILARISAEARALIGRSALALFEVGLTEEEAFGQVSDALPAMAAWVARARGLPLGPLGSGGGGGAGQGQQGQGQRPPQQQQQQRQGGVQFGSRGGGPATQQPPPQQQSQQQPQQPRSDPGVQCAVRESHGVSAEGRMAVTQARIRPTPSFPHFLLFASPAHSCSFEAHCERNAASFCSQPTCQTHDTPDK